MDYTKYTTYTVIDFALDFDFVQWVKYPSTEANKYWEVLYKEKGQEIEKARELVLHLQFEETLPTPAEVTAALHELYEAEKIASNSNENHLPKHGSRFIGAAKIAVAASVAIFATISIFLYTKHLNTSTPQHLNTITKRTEKGQKLTFSLPDNTLVKLNAGSQLTYTESTNWRSTIKLTGEAYFDVTKNPAVPFIVTTKQLTTTVLGTTFNISAYQEEDMQVTVATGKVRVEITTTTPPHSDRSQKLSKAFGTGRHNTSTLQSNQQVIYDTSTQDLTKRTVEASTSIAWTKGVLIFTDASYEEVIPRLERWYGVTIHVQNRPIRDWKYSGRYENQSLDQVLTGLSFGKRFEYVISGKNVKIEFK